MLNIAFRIADEEGLREALGPRLGRVLDAHAPLRAVAEQALEQLLLVRRVDDQHLADPRQRRDAIEIERLYPFTVAVRIRFCILSILRASARFRSSKPCKCRRPCRMSKQSSPMSEFRKIRA